MAESSVPPEANGGGALADVVFGSAAGMAAKVFEHPFDLVKVRLQSQPTDRPLTFTGPLDCFKQTYGKEGLRGLYRGISAPILGAACENATLFLVYNRCQDLIRYVRPGPTEGLSEKVQGKKRELSTPELALAGAGAGTATSFVLTPIELIKCRMQVQMLAREGAFGAVPLAPAAPATSAGLSSPSSSGAGPSRGLSTSAVRLVPLQTPPANLPPLEGPMELVLSTVRTKGLKGLWLGQTGTLLRESGGGMAWFTAYELSAKYFLQRRQRAADAASSSSSSSRKLVKGDLKTYELMLSGAAAGVSYNVILFPADSIKSAIQTAAELNPSARPLGFGEMGKRIWRTRGFKGLYAGCGLTVIRSAPSSAMIFAIYETLAAQFGHLL